MTRYFAIVAILVCGLSLAGCGSGTASKTAGAASDAENAAAESQAAETTGQSDASPAELSVTPDTPPDQVVTAFLEARRSGDTRATAALLTSKARSETARYKIDVSSDALPDLEFRVDKPKFLRDNPKGAHVESTWTETLPDGKTESYEITWVLRREQAGWRVAGFAAQLVPGTQKQFLDFENPQDMIRKQQEAMAASQGSDAAEKSPNSPPAEQAQNTTRNGDVPRKR